MTQAQFTKNVEAQGANFRKWCLALLSSVAMLALSGSFPLQARAQVKTVNNFNPGHYIIAYRGINGHVKELLEAPNSPFLGVQKIYEWSEIEPVENGPLHLDEIRADLTYLASKGKFLIIQMQQKDFNAAAGSTVYPAWLRSKNGSPKPGGGFYNCYLVAAPSASHDMYTSMSLPVMWDPFAAYYIKRFYTRLGNALSAMPEAKQALECVNINETATAANLAEVKQLALEGKIKPFNQDDFIANTVDCANTLNNALPRVNVIQYLNHSGPWGPAPNPATNRVGELATRLAAKGIGIGCTNLLPASLGPTNAYQTVYPALRPHAGKVIVGLANQPKEWHLYGGADFDGFAQKIFNLARKDDGSSATNDCINGNYLFWTNTPDHLDDVVKVLKRPGAPWSMQRQRGMVGASPTFVKVFHP